MVPAPDVIPAQAEVLAALRDAVGTAVAWPWDRLDQIAGDGAGWPEIEDALVRAGFDPAVLGPTVRVAELIEGSLTRRAGGVAVPLRRVNPSHVAG
jgi:hypothetical protein